MEKFKEALKRTTAVLMIVVLLIGIAPIGCLADVEWSEFALRASASATSGVCGENLTWTLDESLGVLTIEGSGEMEDYMKTDSEGELLWDYSAGDPVPKVPYANFVLSEEDWYYYDHTVKVLIIKEGVTSVGEWAFKAFDALRYIEIPRSMEKIDRAAFSDCANLDYIYYTGTETEWNNISIGYFNDDLENVEFVYEESISKDIIEEINCTGGTFGNNLNWSLDAYKNLRIWGEGATDEGYPVGAPWSDLGVKTIEVDSGVTKIGYYAFYNCEDLERVFFSDTVEDIHGYAFSIYYEDLKSINVDENNMNYSSDSFGVLYNKDKTRIIAYPDGREEKEYVIPNGVKYVNYDSFAGCINLEKVVIPNTVESIESRAFWGCENLYDVAIPQSVKDIKYRAFCLTPIETVDIPAGVFEIDSEAFLECEKLKTVTISDTVKSIGYRAFEGCINLTDVYYSGSQSEWNEISIDENNESLTNATIHFAKESHTHTYTAKTTKTATCTAAGIITYTCSCGENYTKTIPAKGHNSNTALKAVSATYTSTGLTAGKKCSVCGTVTVAQQTVAKLTLGKVDGLKAKKVKVAKKSEITLTWNSLGDGVKYEVYIKNGKKWTKLTTTSKTSYTVKKDGKKKYLKADKEYQFRVRAVVDDIKGKYSSTLKVETIPSTATLKLKAGKKQLTASWSKVSDISGYEVQYSTSKKMKSAKTVNAKKSSKKTTIKKLTKGKKYFVRVRTYKTVNGKKIYSDWSTVKNVKVK
ncbi:MAG: leucine-rich repeat protein [Clostridia bacterium]|nr:leucine-rich repeat protein [Clostridia bacterium]